MPLLRCNTDFFLDPKSPPVVIAEISEMAKKNDCLKIR